MSSDRSNGSNDQNRPDSDTEPTRDANGRWLPGHCPNPRGRPRKKPKRHFDQSVLRTFGKTMVEIRTNGKTQMMSRREALQGKMYESAMKGRVTMQRFLYNEFEKDDEKIAEMIRCYDQLQIEWKLENPDYRKANYRLPREIELELQHLQVALNYHFPDQYPLHDPKTYEPKGHDEGDEDVGENENDESEGERFWGEQKD